MSSRRSKMDISSMLSSGTSSHDSVNPPTSASAAAEDSAIPSRSSTASSTASGGRPSQRARKHSATSLVHQATTTNHALNKSPTSTSNYRSSPTAAYSRPHVPHRSSSSASMDTLADLASMQHYHQTVRQNSSSSLRSGEPSPSLSSNLLPLDSFPGDRTPGSVTPSGLRKGSVVADLPMSDAPTVVVQPKSFAATSLSEEESETIATLTKDLNENSYLRSSHIQLVSLLHKGFILHISPDEDGQPTQDPTTYPLLEDLRQARTAFATRFALGEQVWLDLLHDEAMLARNPDDRVAVIESCQKAVQEEAASTALWRFYGDWMVYLYKASSGEQLAYEENTIELHPLVGQILEQQTWSEEDMMIGREVFTWNGMLDVWRQGITATEWHINDSNLVWDPHMQILLHDLSSKSNTDRINHLQQLFLARLSQPHATWDQTSSVFSSFLTQNNSDAWEDMMKFASQRGAAAKQHYEMRQDFEFKLQQAAREGDSAEEHSIMSRYLEWEFEQNRRKNAPHFSHQLLSALCERANLKFPDDAGFWEDHVDLVMEHGRPSDVILDVASRATRHVPWSGDLWSKRLYALEAAGKPFEQLEDVKHHATSTGLLEDERLGSMDDLIKVYMAWCGFLRRRAFAPESGEDERDMAEVGIGSSMENVMNIGSAKYGKEFKGDPYFRIERIFFKFYSQLGNVDDGRRLWQKLSIMHGDQFSFWDKYYDWEMLTWGKELGRWQTTGGIRPLPVHATAVLQKAVRRPNLDYAEQMIEMYLHHCAQHESIQKLQEAQIEVRRLSKQIARRRAKEMADAQAQQAAYEQQYAEAQAQHVASTVDSQDAHDGQKRKRSNADADQEQSQKRPKVGDGEETAQQKRDREHNTIVVKNLPAGVDEQKVTNFFRDCGKITSVQIGVARDGKSAAATIEFEDHGDIASAQTKDQKDFDGQLIEVHAGTRTTVYVANFPASADEAYIKDMFSGFGDVVSIRFPSLKYNTHRRFCYVQFSTAEEAEAACELNDNKVEQGLKLLVAISDPAKKKDREGAQHDGRELFVGHIHWETTEEELRALLNEYGEIERIRFPRSNSGKNKGYAFVTYCNKEDAEAACAMNHRALRGRVIKVDKADANAKGAGKLQAVSSSENNTNGVGDAASPMSIDSVPPSNDFKDRTISLMNLPDTVNDTRVRALAEKYGPVNKIVLQPLHQGAIVEYKDVHDAGKASLALEGHNFEPGYKLRVGSVAELKRQKPRDKKSSDHQPMKSQSQRQLKTSGPISRPSQRGGRRGGLGFKSSRPTAPPAADKQKQKQTQANGDGDGDGGAASGKSQDDFRAMLK